MPRYCGDGRDAAGEAAGETDENVLDRGRAVVLRGEHLGVIGIELELGLVGLLLAEAEEALDDGVAVRAVHPIAGRAPFELGGLGGVGQRLAGADEGLDVDAVLGAGCSCH